MDYITGGRNKKKRYYRIKKNKKCVGKSTHNATVTRISCEDFDDPSKNKTIGRVMPRIGDTVIIIIKPYQDYNCEQGVVQRVLTKKRYHSRGHKVLLKSGKIGRTLKIL